VPAITHYQHDQADLASIPLKNHFQLIMSSHALEHQPDLVRHLQKVSRLLRKGGYYLAFVPNKRFCFDHYKAVRVKHVLGPVPEVRVVAKGPQWLLNVGTLSARMAVLRSCALDI
jgi:SAM-dependent methyltransferase